MRPRFLSKHWRALPDEVIGDPTRPHMWRWYLFECRFFQIVVNKWLTSDEPVLHDHAWWNVSVRLRGQALEFTDSQHDGYAYGELLTGQPMRRFRFRRATDRHCIALRSPVLWTLFITGPASREWGYLVRGRWVPWKSYRPERRTR